jgi:hypothetical protein
MPHKKREAGILLILITVLSGWLIPGGGLFLLGKKKQAVLVFVVITLTFGAGLYIGSIAVIDPVNEKLWYVVQMCNSPFAAVLGHITVSENLHSFGKPAEIGQIYTGISGMLNFLCILNTIQFAYSRSIKPKGQNA